MKNELIIKLSEELKEFLKRKPLRNFSAFAEVKIFVSAYLHMTNSLAIYVGPDSFSDNESEEVKDLWGLSFCKISDYKKMYKKDVKFLEGLSKKQKESISTELNEKKSIVDLSAFILLDKSSLEDTHSQVEDELTQKFKKTHHKLLCKDYTLWWSLDNLYTDGYQPDLKSAKPQTLKISIPENSKYINFAGKVKLPSA